MTPTNREATNWLKVQHMAAQKKARAEQQKLVMQAMKKAKPEQVRTI